MSYHLAALKSPAKKGDIKSQVIVHKHAIAPQIQVKHESKHKDKRKDIPTAIKRVDLKTVQIMVPVIRAFFKQDLAQRQREKAELEAKQQQAQKLYAQQIKEYEKQLQEATDEKDKEKLTYPSYPNVMADKQAQDAELETKLELILEKKWESYKLKESATKNPEELHKLFEAVVHYKPFSGSHIIQEARPLLVDFFCNQDDVLALSHSDHDVLYHTRAYEKGERKLTCLKLGDHSRDKYSSGMYELARNWIDKKKESDYLDISHTLLHHPKSAEQQAAVREMCKQLRPIFDETCRLYREHLVLFYAQGKLAGASQLHQFYTEHEFALTDLDKQELLALEKLLLETGRTFHRSRFHYIDFKYWTDFTTQLDESVKVYLQLKDIQPTYLPTPETEKYYYPAGCDCCGEVDRDERLFPAYGDYLSELVTRGLDKFKETAVNFLSSPPMMYTARLIPELLRALAEYYAKDQPSLYYDYLLRILTCDRPTDPHWHMHFVKHYFPDIKHLCREPKDCDLLLQKLWRD